MRFVLCFFVYLSLFLSLFVSFYKRRVNGDIPKQVGSEIAVSRPSLLNLLRITSPNGAGLIEISLVVAFSDE